MELFVPKIRTWVARSSPEKFVFEIPKQFHSWILNYFLITDFCSNGFSEIYLAYFTRRDFLMNSRVHLNC